VRWKKHKPISSLTLHDGDWSFSQYFALVDTCHEWGRLPSDFGLCGKDDDLAVMAAYSGTVSRMRAWEQQEQEREIEEKTRRSRKGR